MKEIRINCDLGEGIVHEEKIMPYIYSCSIACGGHFGDQETIAKTINLAQKYDIKTGIHPSFPDRAGFGRRIMDIEMPELLNSIVEQIQLFIEVAGNLDQQIDHVKAHGALYNLAVKDSRYMDLIIEAMKICSLSCSIYSSPFTQWNPEYSSDLRWIKEAFGDRRYMNDGSLSNRKIDRSVIVDEKEVWNQIQSIHSSHKVITIDGHEINISADTYCIHGDTDQAHKIVKYIHQQIQQDESII